MVEKWHIRKKIVRAYMRGEDVLKNFNITQTDLDYYIESYEPRTFVPVDVSILVDFGSRNEPYDERTEDEMINEPEKKFNPYYNPFKRKVVYL